MHLLRLSLSLLCYIALAAAWPWPPTLQNLGEALGRRDDYFHDPADLAERAAASNAAAATTKAAASNTAAKATGSGAATTAAKSNAKGTTKPTASVSVPQNAPDGGFTMITPAQTAPTYAKIGAAVTFVWNYTSLLVPPSAVDVIASNSDGVWTIASNISVKETSAVWNTSNEATPLPMESYTFVIYDSEAGVTAVPSPGHLSPYIGYQFAMYKPQAYVPSKEFFCVTCNGAGSLERQSLLVVLGTGLVTVLSFTYFSCGFLGAW